MSCARCGAPIAARNSAAADSAAGGFANSVAPAGPVHQLPAKGLMLSGSWWVIGGGTAIFLGSLLPWISVYVFDGNVFGAADDPNLFKAVEVANSISGGARAASAVFGLTLIGLAVALRSVSARGVFVKPRAYAYGIPLIALSVLGIIGYGIFTLAGFAGFREADGLGIVGYGIFTLKEKHPILAEDGTAGSAHVSFTPNIGIILIVLGCTAAAVGALSSLRYASPQPRRARHAIAAPSGSRDPRPGLPHASGPGLDARDVPVRHRLTAATSYRLALASVACGIVLMGLSVPFMIGRHKPSDLFLVGVIPAIAAAWIGTALRKHPDKRIRRLAKAGFLLGYFSFFAVVMASGHGAALNNVG